MDAEKMYQARRISDGKWIQGSLVIIDPPPVCFIHEVGPETALIVKETDNTMADWGMSRQYSAYEVERDTVSRCLGRSDKSHTLIFEGQIVRVTEDNGQYTDVLVCYGKFRDVNWLDDDSAIGWYLAFDKYTLSVCCGESVGDDWTSKAKIIGNKWDDPELLKNVFRDNAGADADPEIGEEGEDV